MNINDIKPSINGESDKYSWNLYRYLKKNKGEHRILWDTKDDKPLHPINVYVLNGNTGTTLLNILWGKLGIFHWDDNRLEGFIDITEKFWDDYVRDGRCAFHDHNEVWLQGGEHRCTKTSPVTKVCNWCGAELRKTVETVVTEVERWEVQ